MPKDPRIKKVLVIGSGPIIIGQAAEFDYSGTQACRALKAEGIETVLLNSNPATIMTDPDVADHVYIEPMTLEVVERILDIEKPDSVLPNLGGQMGLNLSMELARSGYLDRTGIRLLACKPETIDRAEDRNQFENLLNQLNIPRAKGKAVTKIEDGIAAAAEIGYPVLVRPSFVLGGRAMQIVANEDQLRHYLRTAVEIDEDKPVLVDKYIEGREVEIDAICDGRDVFVPGIMELVERTGVHSGDSISVYPPYSLRCRVKERITA